MNALANEQNLKPNIDSAELARQMQKKSAEKRKANNLARKTMRETLLALLETPVSAKGVDGQITTMSAQEASTLSLLAQAMKGNVKAYEVIRDTVGEKPIERVVAAVDKSIVDEVESIVNGKA